MFQDAPPKKQEGQSARPPAQPATPLGGLAKPDTVVINREAREKLVVHHFKNGSNILSLEKLNSAEMAQANETDKPAAPAKPAEPIRTNATNTPLTTPLDDAVADNPNSAADKQPQKRDEVSSFIW